jgi:hypothetical protein
MRDIKTRFKKLTDISRSDYLTRDPSNFYESLCGSTPEILSLKVRARRRARFYLVSLALS